MTVKREVRELELLPDQWAQLESIRTVLDHDELEETIKVLIEIGVKAISVTTNQNRFIRVFGGQKREVGEKCSKCGRKQIVFDQEVGIAVAAEAKVKTPDPSEEED